MRQNSPEYPIFKSRSKNLKNNNEREFLLTPHINKVDNYHYASNIKLPGNK